jgi:hypothetical protein
VASDDDVLAWARDGLVQSQVFEPRLDPPLAAIVERALARDPANRYPHAGALGYDLRHVALSMGVADGRAFLRSAIAHAFGDDLGEAESDVTGDADRDVTGTRAVRRAQPVPPHTPADRFARLRGDECDPFADTVPEGRESGAVPIAGATGVEPSE